MLVCGSDVLRDVILLDAGCDDVADLNDVVLVFG